MKLRSCTEAAINRRKLEIEIDAETFKKECDKAFLKLSKKMNVPGFRKGKAPRQLIEKMYGKEVFYDEAFRALYPGAISDAIDEAKLEYVDDEVGLDIVEAGENGLVFTAEITVRPEVKLPKYKGIKVTRPSEEVTDKDIDRELNNVRERNARTVDIDDRPAQDGDTVNIDFAGYLGDEQFEGGTAESYNLVLGSHQFIPGFEEQIAGKSVGEEFDVNVTFPEEYGAENLAGQDAVFKCKLNSIKSKEYFDIDDDFAKDFGDCDTLEEYKADLREQIAERKKRAADNAVESQIFDFLQDEMECVVPEVMIENRIDMEVRDVESRLKERQLTLKDYLEYSGMEMQNLRDQMREQCEKQVRMRLAMEEIAKKEKIEVSDSEIDERVKEIADTYSMDEEKVRRLIDMDGLRTDVMVEKAVDLVRAAAEVTAETADGDDSGDGDK